VWELLYLKLGKDPHKTIPLFAGLRPLQAKLVTLMGELKEFPRGQAIIKRGDMGNEMFVLVNGTVDVFIHVDGQQKYIQTYGRGDVVGEMGLIRHQKRTADVIAAEDVEAIVVNERFLSHMQGRYPRTGAKIFLNIAKILSDRLQASQRA
jgi:CRP-like cAMP-binding protein